MSSPAEKTEAQVAEDLRTVAAAMPPPGQTDAEAVPPASDPDDNPEVWAEMLDDDEGGETPESSEADESLETPPAEPPPEPPPAEPPTPEGETPEPPPAEIPEAAQAPETETPEAVPPPVEATPPEPPPVEEPPKQTAEEITQMRTDAEKQLQEHFALTEDDAVRFRENPAEVLPQMAAKLYLDVYESVLSGITASLPQMVVGLQQQQQASQNATEKFYGKWKALKTDAGVAAVDRIGRAYRQANPQSTLDDFVNDVGLQAMIALRLPIEGVSVPAVPAAPQTQIPPAPAGVTTVPVTPQPIQTNPFAALAEEMLDEDNEVS